MVPLTEVKQATFRQKALASCRGRKTQSSGQGRKSGANAGGLHPVHRPNPRISHRGVGLARSP